MARIHRAPLRSGGPLPGIARFFPDRTDRRAAPGAGCQQTIAAYDAPFPTAASKAATCAYPPLVPFSGNVAVPDQLRAWEVFRRWKTLHLR